MLNLREMPMEHNTAWANSCRECSGNTIDSVEDGEVKCLPKANKYSGFAQVTV